MTVSSSTQSLEAISVAGLFECACSYYVIVVVHADQGLLYKIEDRFAAMEKGYI